MKRLLQFGIAIKRGGASLQDRMDKERKPYIFVGLVCVREKYQRQGYMRKVLDIAFAEGDRLGVPVILETDAKNKLRCSVGVMLMLHRFFCVKIIFDNVDFQLFLTQILYLNSKRVKIGGEHMEYLNKVLGIEVAYEDLQERCSAEKKTREEILPSAQMLLLHFIYGGEQELSTSQAAKNLELTPTSISRASKQLEEMGLLHIKKEGVPQFYRFSHPITNQYPAMIELFTRKLDAIQLPEDAVLTPLPMDEDISSLSAILLDDDYYEFLKQGKVTVDGVTVLDAAYLIPFKAKAWMDLADRKAAGEHVDSKNIKKHKNDVFRLTELIDPTAKVVAPQGVYADIQEFVQRMKNENVDIKQLGLVGRTKEKILEELKAMYETL